MASKSLCAVPSNHLSVLDVVQRWENVDSRTCVNVETAWKQTLANKAYHLFAFVPINFSYKGIEDKLHCVQQWDKRYMCSMCINELILGSMGKRWCKAHAVPVDAGPWHHHTAQCWDCFAGQDSVCHYTGIPQIAQLEGWQMLQVVYWPVSSMMWSLHVILAKSIFLPSREANASPLMSVSSDWPTRGDRRVHDHWTKAVLESYNLPRARCAE